MTVDSTGWYTLENDSNLHGQLPQQTAGARKGSSSVASLIAVGADSTASQLLPIYADRTDTSADQPLKPSAAKEKTTIACDNCARRRAKCDGKMPSCSYCLARSKPCTFNREIKKRGPKTGYVDKLHERIRELEAMLASASIRDPDLHASGHPDRLQPLVTTTIYTPHMSIAQANEFVVVEPPALSDHPHIYLTSHAVNMRKPSRSNSADPLTNTFVHDAEWVPDSFKMQMSAIHGTVMLDTPNPSGTSASAQPRTEIRRDLIDRFFDNIHPQFPVLSHHCILTDPQAQSPILLNALYAVALTQPCHPTYHTYNHGDNYYQKACSLVDNSLENHSCYTIYALTLLSYYAFGCGQCKKADMFFSLACKMSFSMGINREPSLEQAAALGRSELDLRRRLWLMVHQSDISVAMVRTEVPPSIRDEDWEIHMPEFENLVEENNFTVVREQELENFSYLHLLLSKQNSGMRECIQQNVVSFFAQKSELMRINYRIVLYVRMALGYVRAPSHFDMDLERSLLETALNDWFARQPSYFQKIPDGSYGTKFYSAEPPHWTIAHAQLIYQLARIILHGTRLSFDGTASSPPSSLISLDPSFWECIDASKIVSTIISRFMEHNPMFSYVGPLMVTTTYRAGMIYVVGMQCGYFQGDDMQQAYDIVSMFVRAIRQIARYSMVSTLFANKLEGVLRCTIPLRVPCLGTGSIAS